MLLQSAIVVCRRFCTVAAVKPSTSRLTKKRQIALSKLLYNMKDLNIEATLAPLRSAVKEQVFWNPLSSYCRHLKYFSLFKGNIVKTLKEQGANDIDLTRAVAELKIRKKKLDDAVLEFFHVEIFDF